MANKEILRKLILILGLTNTTFGSVMDSKILIIIGGIITAVGTAMIVGLK